MSFCFIILFVTAWRKNNKLIIYLLSSNLQTEKPLYSVVWIEQNISQVQINRKPQCVTDVDDRPATLVIFIFFYFLFTKSINIYRHRSPRNSSRWFQNAVYMLMPCLACVLSFRVKKTKQTSRHKSGFWRIQSKDNIQYLTQVLCVGFFFFFVKFQG